jgi:predicted unusual protein kinase regulating ubiquinone biosynthesis (AarF/ABC1/UbiB family)
VRALIVVRLAAEGGLRAWRLARFGPRDEAARKAAEEQLWALEGRRLAQEATRLGGLLIKVGQFLSTRADLFPESFTSALTGLQDVVAPVPWPAIEGALVEAYGETPVGPGRLFVTVEPEPLAAASLAQVHRARLEDGREVVLKVLRPGIRALVETDLATVSWVLDWVGRHTTWGRRYDLGAIAREFAAVTRQELDMPGEGRRGIRFAAMFADDPRVRAPAVHQDWTRPGVLVMDEVHGMRPERETLLAAGVDPAAVASLLLESYMRQWLGDGLFHADPHAGNLFVQADGGVTYVDFGMMAEIGPDDRSALQNMVLALVARDAQGVAEAMDDLGFVRPGVDRRPLERALAFLLARMFAPGGEAMRARDTDELEGLLTEMRAFLHQHPFQLPARYTFLGRALGMLAGLTASLAPDQPFMPTIASAARSELARPGRQRSGGILAGLDWGRLGRALADYAAGDRDALVALAETVLPTWHRLSRAPRTLLRLARRLDAGEAPWPVPEAPPPSGRRLPTAVLAGASAVAAAIVGGTAPLGRDLLWCVAAALGLLALARG